MQNATFETSKKACSRRLHEYRFHIEFGTQAVFSAFAVLSCRLPYAKDRIGGLCGSCFVVSECEKLYQINRSGDVWKLFSGLLAARYWSLHYGGSQGLKG